MAGYLFLLNNLESLYECVRSGVYGTILKPPYWKLHHEGTVADFATMKAGDNVYFFHDRKIYGVGRLVQLRFDCKFLNYPDAGISSVPDYEGIKSDLLEDSGEESSKKRVICVFEPCPCFFSEGVDMDDALLSNPNSFRMLRVLWKRSFIKFEEEENQALKNIILKRNQKTLQDPTNSEGVLSFDKSYHIRLNNKVSPIYQLTRGISEILQFASDGSKMKHEMAIEMGILHQLSELDTETTKIFGSWDYLSHQVVASPFKHIDYMDKMDIFGYSYIPGHPPTRNKYLIVEVKKDETIPQNVDQLMRYVDWVKDEYCYGDYAMIRAFIVSYEFSQDVIQRAKDVAFRNYTIGVRPTRSEKWSDISLVKFRYNESGKKIDLALDWSSVSQ